MDFSIFSPKVCEKSQVVVADGQVAFLLDCPLSLHLMIEVEAQNQ